MTPELRKRIEVLAEAKTKELFELNPNGFTVATYVNADILDDQFIHGAEAMHQLMGEQLKAARAEIKKYKECEFRWEQDRREIERLKKEKNTESEERGINFDFWKDTKAKLTAATALIERLASALEIARGWCDAGAVENARMREALEYQLTALRKICEGSMFTPESERAAAEKIIKAALAGDQTKSEIT